MLFSATGNRPHLAARGTCRASFAGSTAHWVRRRCVRIEYQPRDKPYTVALDQKRDPHSLSDGRAAHRSGNSHSTEQGTAANLTHCAIRAINGRRAATPWFLCAHRRLGVSTHLHSCPAPEDESRRQNWAVKTRIAHDSGHRASFTNSPDGKTYAGNLSFEPPPILSRNPIRLKGL